MAAYKSIALLNPWELVKVNLLRKRIFKDIIKNLEMTYPGLSRWAINPMTKVLIRERKGDLTERGEVMWSWRQRLESCSHKPRILKPPDTARVKEGYSPEPSEGLWPCWHLDLTSGPQSHKRMHFCSFKLPSLWSFVTAALRDRYRSRDHKRNCCQGQEGEIHGCSSGWAHLKGQLPSVPGHSGQAECELSNTRSDFLRETKHTRF